MSISKSLITLSFLPPPDSKPSNSSETRKSISLSSSSSSCLAILTNHYQNRFWHNSMRSNKSYTSQRRFLVRSAVLPGAPPPSEPPSNIINWILGLAMTVVLPFFTGKWTSLLRIKNEVETAVQIGEDIVKGVGKVAEKVEKAAEKMQEEIPKGGEFRKVVDFVEHVAEVANRDAHIVGDFIDKVQEVEEQVEDYVESIVEGRNHEHHKEDNQENEEQEEEEDRGQEQAKEEEDNQENEAQEEEEEERGQEEAKLEEEEDNNDTPKY